MPGSNFNASELATERELSSSPSLGTSVGRSLVRISLAAVTGFLAATLIKSFGMHLGDPDVKEGMIWFAFSALAGVVTLLPLNVNWRVVAVMATILAGIFVELAING